jgi:hypothetical protein
MNKTFAGLLLLGLIGTGSLRAQTVNCLVAVVGGQAVTLTDLQIAQEFGLFSRDIEGVGGDPRLAVLEALIGQKVVAEMARGPFTIEKSELDLALESLREKLGPAAFTGKLRKFGLREDDLRPYLEERLRYERVVSRRFAVTIPVSRGEVEEFYRDVYVPEQKAKGLEPESLESVNSALEARVRENLKARKVAEWVRTIRDQAEVWINRDCLDSKKEAEP